MCDGAAAGGQGALREQAIEAFKQGETDRRRPTEKEAEQSLKSSQSKQPGRTQAAGGSLRRCPMIPPQEKAGPAPGRDEISDSALLGFLNRHRGTFWKKKKKKNKKIVQPGLVLGEKKDL